MLHNVSLNASMRANLLSLQQTSKLQDITSNRLSTGLKVNSAIDNPSAYYTAQSLSDRASDLNALLDAMSQGIQTLKAVAETIDAASDFLQQAKAVASQALETAQNIAARVSTEEELLAAVSSGKKGLIVLEKDIAMSDNQNIVLSDGQSLVGAAYLDKNAKNTSISFTFTTKTNYGIKLGDNSILANLDISYDMNDKGKELGAIDAAGKSGIVFQNLDITVNSHDAETDSGYFWTVSGGDIVVKGTVNVKNTGAPGVYPDYSNSQIIGFHGSRLTLDNAVHLNISTRGFSSHSLHQSEVIMNGTSEINILTSGHQAMSFYNTVLIMNDAAAVNIRNTGTSSRGLLNTNLRMNSALNKISIENGNNASISSSKPWGGGTLSMNVAAGAEIILDTGTYSVGAPIILDVPDGYGSNDLSDLGFNKDDTKKSDRGDIFDDYDAYMEEKADDVFGTTEAEKSYTELLEQYDMLISDGSYKGVNLLKKDSLKVSFNEDRSSYLNIAGVDASSQALGLTGADWLFKSDVEKSLSGLDAAIASLRDFAARFGTYNNIVTTRQEFTEAMINVLEEGADKLTLADMNQESANMLALQTRQMLAVNSLSLASQASQSVLKLF